MKLLMPRCVTENTSAASRMMNGPSRRLVRHLPPEAYRWLLLLL